MEGMGYSAQHQSTKFLLTLTLISKSVITIGMHHCLNHVDNVHQHHKDTIIVIAIHHKIIIANNTGIYIKYNYIKFCSVYNKTTIE